MSNRQAIVLVHGAFHGPWCWDKVVGPLTELGLQVATPNLYDGPHAGDPAVVQAEVDRLSVDGPVLVCAHSFGGFPATALDPQNIAGMVYLCAFLPDDNEWFPEFPTVPAFFDMVGMDDAGVMTVHPERAADLFYNDCSEADAQWAVPQLRSHSMAGAEGVVANPAWRAVPSSYVSCRADNVLTQEYMHACGQRMAGCTQIPTGHSPMISRPDLVIELLLAALDASKLR